MFLIMVLLIFKCTQTVADPEGNLAMPHQVWLCPPTKKLTWDTGKHIKFPLSSCPMSGLMWPLGKCLDLPVCTDLFIWQGFCWMMTEEAPLPPLLDATLPGTQIESLTSLAFSLIHSFISFILTIFIVPLQGLYCLEALPTTARILHRSFTPKRTGNCR